jgi:peptidyl-prolyl cis-trans isomerase D
VLEFFRKGQRWLSLIFVSVIGLVFVFFLGAGGGNQSGSPSGNFIVQLDDDKLTSRDFERAKSGLEARLREELGEAYDQVVARDYIASQALGSLTNGLVLAAAAREMGLHTTREELRRVVQNSPIFLDEDGRFSPAAFDRFAAYEFGSQRAFIHNFTRDLLGQKLIQLIINQSVVSDAEIDLRTRYELEETRIAYVAIETNSLPSGGDAVIEASLVEAYSQDHDAELRARFAERKAEFSEAERIRARHILVLAAPDASQADEAHARERIESARLRIENGEAFVTVAEALSEDLGTAKVGGDLGLFARGDNDPALEEVAFRLEVGAISSPVRSGHGFHLIRVDEKMAATSASFESKRLMLARESVARVQARKLAEEQSARLVAAIEAGTSLEDAARLEGLSLERPSSLRRRPDGFIPGLGAATDVLTTAFALAPGESSPLVFDVADRRVLIQVLDRTSPSEEELANERSDRRIRARAEKENRALQTWVDETRSQLEAAGRLKVNVELALGR